MTFIAMHCWKLRLVCMDLINVHVYITLIKILNAKDTVQERPFNVTSCKVCLCVASKRHVNAAAPAATGSALLHTAKQSEVCFTPSVCWMNHQKVSAEKCFIYFTRDQRTEDGAAMVGWVWTLFPLRCKLWFMNCWFSGVQRPLSSVVPSGCSGGRIEWPWRRRGPVTPGQNGNTHSKDCHLLTACHWLTY